MLRLYPARHRAIMAIILLLFVGLTIPASGALALEELPRTQREELAAHLALMLEAEETREYRETLALRIADLEGEIVELRERIVAAEDTYLAARDRTVTALRWIHRRGATSYLEVLLGASSLRELLRRAEVARTAARGALAAMDEVRGEKEMLDRMREDVVRLDGERGDLAAEYEGLAAVAQAVEKNAARLAGVFGGGWPTVEAELGNLMVVWIEQAEPYLRALPGRFARIAGREVEPEGVELEISLFSVRATVPEESLTALLTGESGLESTAFRFTSEEAQLVDTARRIVVRGQLEIDRSGVVRYSVWAIDFAGLPIEDSALLEAIDGLQLDLGPALGGLHPQRLTLGDGHLVLVLSFFS